MYWSASLGKTRTAAAASLAVSLTGGLLVVVLEGPARTAMLMRSTVSQLLERDLVVLRLRFCRVETLAATSIRLLMLDLQDHAAQIHIQLLRLCGNMTAKAFNLFLFYFKMCFNSSKAYSSSDPRN
jgi:hypothetical protein